MVKLKATGYILQINNMRSVLAMKSMSGASGRRLRRVDAVIFLLTSSDGGESSWLPKEAAEGSVQCCLDRQGLVIQEVPCGISWR